MRAYTFCFFVLFLCPFSILGQDKDDTLIVKSLYAKADSLSNIDLENTILTLDTLDQFLSRMKIDAYQWKSYVLRGNALKSGNEFEKSLEFYEKAIDILDEIGDKKSLSIVYVNQANAYRRLGFDSLALSSFNNVIEVCNDTTKYDRRLSAFSYFSIGDVYNKKNDSLAIANYLKSKEIASLIDYNELLGGIHYNLGILFKRKKKYQRSIEYLQKSEQYYGPNHINLLMISNALAQCLHNLGQSEEAEKKYKAILSNPKVSLDDRVFTMNSLSILYKETGQYSQAERMLTEALVLAKDEDHLETKYGEMLGNLGSIYTKTGRFQDALKQYLLAKPLIINSKNPDLHNKAFILENIISAKLRIQNNGKEDEDMKQYIIFNDSLFEQTKESIDEEMLEKYESDIKQLENEQLKKDQKNKEVTIQRKNQYLMLAILGIGLITLLSILLWRQKIKQENLNSDLKVQRDRVKILNRELNHRVKNNLSFMSSLLEMEGRRSTVDSTKRALKESETRLKALSLVHESLFKEESDTEINLKPYLQEIVLHLVEIFERPEKEISVDFNFIDYTLDAESAMRIGLILNELITNSIKHAFTDVDHPKIRVETLQQGEKLLLRYKDNGPGIQEKVLAQNSSSDSMGIKLIALLKQQLERDIIIQFK